MLTAGQSFILGYTDEQFGIKQASEESPVIIFDDFTTSSHYVDFPFKVKSSAMKLLTLNNPKDNIHCAYNVLQNIGFVPVSHERHWISTFAKFEVLLPKSADEQKKIGSYFANLDQLITLHQRKCKIRNLRCPKSTAITWEQRKFSELYEKVSRKNDLTYGKDDIISVANMYFKADSYITDESYLLTYNIFELGDIAFEGNKSKNYAHGRFVENTIGNGIVSHVFDVFKPIMKPYDLQFWKYAINNEQLMGGILLRSTKASTMMTNLVANDFLQETFLVPAYPEQQKIGAFFQELDRLITLHQRELEKLQNIKKSMLEKMFV